MSKILCRRKPGKVSVKIAYVLVFLDINSITDSYKMAEERELKDLSMEELLQLSPRDFIECVRTTYSLYWAVGYQVFI